MSELFTNLAKLYVPLVAWVGFGMVLGRSLPKAIPHALGKGLFWFGVPLSVFGFLRQADLSGSVWIAPVVAWVALACGAGLAWLWIVVQTRRGSDRSFVPQNDPAKGSFLLAAMVGNTGYLGYPVALALVGPQYFGWAIFYDTLGSTLGAYCIGVLLGARFGLAQQGRWTMAQAFVRNPALWAFSLGMLCRSVQFHPWVEQGLLGGAWLMLVLALLLLGMRLSQLDLRLNLNQAVVTLFIKMLMIPLIFGLALRSLGLTGLPHFAVVLQLAMPPAFATLVIAEAYDLDRQLTVTCLAVGSVGLLLTLPIWMLLFSPGDMVVTWLY
ncbi:MAG: AEC family transporter [Synechococcales cyanobacterium K44_A2020_017]|nr:AEC family transporter [Synechococcales cyanobacterium K32_A2020_035]MBF2093597.1 AEC family transporter [Synechococcales cyanobacterium K44_A2020_017]